MKRVVLGIVAVAALVMAQSYMIGSVIDSHVGKIEQVINKITTPLTQAKTRMCDYQDTVYCNGVGTVVCTNCESGENPAHCYRRHLQAIEAVLANCNLKAKMFAAYGYVDGQGPNPNVKPVNGLVITDEVVKLGIEALNPAPPDTK